MDHITISALHILASFTRVSIFYFLFFPGFYETRIAYYSWRGAQGYRFSLIPDY